MLPALRGETDDGWLLQIERQSERGGDAGERNTH